MREFMIQLHSVRDVQNFVNLATTMGFPILVSDGHHQVDGGSFMEMFCLDCTRALTVSCQCSENLFDAFRTASADLLAD